MARSESRKNVDLKRNRATTVGDVLEALPGDPKRSQGIRSVPRKPGTVPPRCNITDFSRTLPVLVNVTDTVIVLCKNTLTINGVVY
jgi:hypothetical protein